MKKIVYYFFVLLSIQTAFAQSEFADERLQNILAEKTDSVRIGKLYEYLLKTQESDPLLNLKILKNLLIQSQKNKDAIGEAIALSQIGYQYRALENKTKGLEYGLKGTQLAEQIGNKILLAVIKLQLAHNYIGIGDYRKAIELYLFAEAAANTNTQLLCASAMDLGEVYLTINKLDSALIYSHKAEQLSINSDFRTFRDYIYNNLGKTYAKLGNPTLALAYFNLAEKQYYEIKNQNLLSGVYYNLALYYLDAHENDSCLVFAKKAIAVVQNTPYALKSLAPAKLLMNIYRKNNNDSAMKYADIYRIANDSVFNISAIQQTQLLAFDEEIRQQKILEDKKMVLEQSKQNVQYFIIAIGILTLTIIYLLLSRSFITNARLIEFFGVVALLIVFEFLNLILHPFLEQITHHNPILMLLGLVGIAALLVPLHHKIEKWAIAKLVEKNKQIRLAAAKKTIMELDTKSGNL